MFLSHGVCLKELGCYIINMVTLNVVRLGYKHHTTTSFLNPWCNPVSNSSEEKTNHWAITEALVDGAFALEKKAENSGGRKSHHFCQPN